MLTYAVEELHKNPQQLINHMEITTFSVIMILWNFLLSTVQGQNHPILRSEICLTVLRAFDILRNKY
jgi:hypothetical protein